MGSDVSVKCDDCGEVVLWEQLCGMRLVRVVDGKKRIQTKCGCDHLVRTPGGKKVKP